MVEFRSDSVMFVSGRRRFGKSVWVKENVWNRVSRVVLHDPKWEHTILPKQDQEVRLIHTIEDLIFSHDLGHHKILYQPHSSSINDFDQLCALLFQWGNHLLIVDEAASYTSPQFLPHWMGEIIRMGTTRGVGIVSVSQRPRDVHNRLISETDIIISFRLQLETDCQKLAQVVGPEAYKLTTLDPYHYMLYDGRDVHWCTPLPYQTP